MARTVIISDTHMGRLGRRRAGASHLRPLWAGASDLVINGDVAELQEPSMQAEAARQIQLIQKYCESDGVKLTLLSGNHDAFLDDQRHLMLAEGQVLVTHGDVFHPAIAPWAYGRARMMKDTETALSNLGPQQQRDLGARLSIAQHVGHRGYMNAKGHRINRTSSLWLLMRPWRVGLVIRYWQQVPRLAAALARAHAPDARFVIFGHSHRQGIWHRDDRIIINTGSFVFPGRPRAVVIEGNELSVWRLIRNRDLYGFDQAAVAQFDLDRTAKDRQAA